ncbi:DUF2274 domain-containing protein [Sphingomonas sp. PWP1-2]|uniref:DUF2274 domain-containing protein n=1 Tax=Sphingomonas sp. PWP1-2 TaxID=2804558 RepID=UPI003CEB00AF
MVALKLGPLVEDKPVRLTVELPGPVHRDLVRYAAALGAQTGQAPVAPDKLVAPMLERFMATDRAFTRERDRRRS